MHIKSNQGDNSREKAKTMHIRDIMRQSGVPSDSEDTDGKYFILIDFISCV